MAEQATGALSKLVIGFEDVAYGTAATAGFDVPFVSSSLKLDRNKTTSPVIRGDFNPVKPSPGNKAVSGTIVVPFDSIASWYWLKSAFNTVATSGTDPYTHKFTMEGTTKRTSLSIEHQYLDLDTPQYFLYTGCKISSMSLTTGGEGELLLTMQVVGSDREIDTSSFDGTPTEVSYGPLNQSQAALKENDTAYSDATTVSWNINFNPDTSQYVIGGGGALGAIPDGIMAVTGSFSGLFKSVALINKAVGNTETSVEATYTGSASSKVIVEFPEMQFSESDPPIEGPQGIVQTLPMSGYYDDGADASSVVISVINGEAHA